MWDTLLPLLACPVCAADLVVSRRDSPPGAWIEEGDLSCSGCQRSTPIRQGVPDFTGAPADSATQLTQQNFGYSWNAFQETEAHFDQQFAAWIAPVEPADFAGKIVLDAGCGMGRHTDFVARAGAQAVVGVDFSSAVYPAVRRLRQARNAHVVRADIYALPLKSLFEVAYSVGVLHHLPDPRAGYLAMVGKLRPGGLAIAWVYGAENNGWITKGLSPLREQVLSKLPMPVLKAASLGLTAAVVFPVLRLGYLPAARFPALRRKLFYADYLGSIAGYSFRHIYGIVFDHLLPPVAYYLSKEEVAEWGRAVGLRDTGLRWHNRMSWTLTGRLPARAEQAGASEPRASV